MCCWWANHKSTLQHQQRPKTHQHEEVVFEKNPAINTETEAVIFSTVLKPTAKWYLRNFTINVKEDKEMYKYSSLALDNADPLKLRDTIPAIAGYTVWDKLDSLDCSTLIVDTSRDGIHRHEDIMRMKNAIKNCIYVDLETNNRTHGNEPGPVIRHFLNEQMSGKNPLGTLSSGCRFQQH